MTLFYRLRDSLGHALIVLGTLLGIIAIFGYGILRNEGSVAIVILIFGILQLACGIALLSFGQQQNLELTALAVSGVSLFALLIQSFIYIAGASTESTALQLIACFISGMSVVAVLNTMIHQSD